MSKLFIDFLAHFCYIIHILIIQSPHMLPNFTLIALASALLGAVAAILARTLLKDLKSRDILGINFLTMGATLLLLSPLFYYFHPTLKSTALIIIIALIDTAANYFFFKTFEQTEASVATPILSLAPAFTFFFGCQFLQICQTLPWLICCSGFSLK